MSEISRRTNNIDPFGAYNPDSLGFAREITAFRSDSIDERADNQGITRTVSFEVSAENCWCEQPEQSRVIEGFRISSTKHPNILQVQFYDQCFCISPAALAASWAGISILLRSWHVTKALQFGCRQHEKPFRLLVNRGEYLIGGSLCGHCPKPTVPQLEECWEGGILLAAIEGGWRTFFEHVKAQVGMFMWRSFGRHISGMVWTPRYASRRGITESVV